MQKELKNLLKLSLAFMALLLFFSVARLYFYFSNQSVFSANTDFSLLNAFTNGFVYDLKFILAVNSMVILIYFLPFRFRNTIFWQFIVKLFFTVLNSGLVLLYLIDSKYYHAIGEHIGFFNLSDSTLYEQFVFAIRKIDLHLSNAWDIALISLFSFIVLWSSFPSIHKMYFERSNANLYVRFTITVLAILLVWNSVNEAKDDSGDWQVKLFERMNYQTAELAVNSPYYIMRFYYSEKLTNRNYFDTNELETLFSSKKNYISRQKNKKNILIINCTNEISDWAEFEQNIKKRNPNYFVSNNFASQIGNNSKQMDEILLSFPAFNKKSLIKTPYAFNQKQSLAALLKQNGYFTIFASNANKKLQKSHSHFYGFNQFIFQKKNHKLLSKFEQAIRKNKPQNTYFAFFQIENGINETFEYITDNNLDNNTLIIINIHTLNNNKLLFGKTLYLMPDTVNKYKVSTRTQELDIFPSVIDYLNLSEKFIAFGKSVFYKNEKHEVFQYTGNDYVILQDSLLLRYNGQSTKWIIDYKNDPDEFFDLQDSLPVQKVLLENKIRAIIQENNQRLVNNKMTIDN